jgi:hypothetical protein
MGLFAIDLDFCEHRETHPIILGADGANFFGASRFL